MKASKQTTRGPVQSSKQIQFAEGAQSRGTNPIAMPIRNNGTETLTPPCDSQVILRYQSTLGNRFVQRFLTQHQRAVAGLHRDVIQKTEAGDLIDRYTRYWNLREDALGAELLRRAQRGRFAFIGQVLDELSSTNRDDVSYEFMRQASDAALQAFARIASGRRLLDRLYDELSAGHFAEEERRQANRIIHAKEAQIDPRQRAQSLSELKIFPFKLPGITVLNDAPISAERRRQGRVWVRMPVRVLGTRAFRAETRTLPTEVFLSGIELEENEIIGVRMYDLGGELHVRPALYLVQLANETDTRVLEAMGEAAGIGLTLGSGALAGLGIRATMTARVLLWADRAAFTIGLITTTIRDHRGWIIERFGESGRRFLDYVDFVHRAVAVYGMARVVFEMGRLVTSFRSASSNWRQAASEVDDLSSAQRGVVSEVNRRTDEFLANADRIEGAGTQPPRDTRPAGGSRTSATPAEPSTPVQAANPPRAATPSATTTAREMVARLRAEGHDIIVNIGGTGARHEPAHAINLNPNRVAPRRGIPNHIAEPGETIANHFAAGSVDQVVGHHLPPNVLNWDRIAPGAFTVLRSGGRFEIYFRGAHPGDAARLASALREAGFQGVEVISHVLIRARKP